MSLRVSQLVVQLVMLDDYDTIKQADPIPFSGDADGTAVEKLRAWLDDLPAKLTEAEAAAAPPELPNRAARRAKKQKATA